MSMLGSGLGGGEFGAEGEGYSERLHCPLMIRNGRGESLGRRVGSFIQPQGFGGVIKSMVKQVEGFEVGGDERLQSGGMAYAVGHGEFSLITPRWSGRWEYSESEGGELDLRTVGVYCHPEDRWQQNEVSLRAPEVERIMRLIAELLIVSRVDGIGDLDLQSRQHLERLLEELALQGR